MARSGVIISAGPKSSISDEELLSRVVKGSREAFSILVERHTTRYYGLAFRTLLNKLDAEEVVQEAFLKLWHRPGLWDAGKGARFSTWFYRVVANMCIDRNRKKRPVLIEDIDSIAGVSDIQADEAIYRAEQKRMVDSLLLELPENQRMALNLCFYEELSNQEAADIMELSLKALQSLIIRAKSALKEKIAKVNR
ncbi:MAG: sigma-70 family RNA polymerase sigma factor [Thermodesulfobacteriota bacterium]